ncbi:unnamed protein product [Brachionus calyciflorus]|uniref:RRM domain-containing protein n=1 Tax=Brachionus calyciflorus TaxID=104777 RepID=A0A813MMH3_9BILA|nr:unnamed protein product [Brachionus calyciflorus]
MSTEVIQTNEQQNVVENPTETQQNGQTENGNVQNEQTNGHSEQTNGHTPVQNNTASIDKSKLEPEICRKVFVGSLSYSTTEEALRNYFSKFGELMDSVIMKESKSGKSRGFGFVTYTKSSMVDELQKARPHKLDGRELETKRATPKEESGKPGAESTTKKLFVGGIKEGLTDSDLKEYFSKYGNVEDCVIMKDKESNKLRGFGFVTFDDYDPVDKLVLDKNHSIKGQKLIVKKAMPKDGENAGNQKNGNNNQKNNSKQNGNMRQNGRNGPQFNNGPGMFDAPSGFDNNNFNSFGNNNMPLMSNGNNNGMNLMGNMNMNNFAMFAQKMFEAAANNMQTPFNGNTGGMNNGNNMGFGGFGGGSLNNGNGLFSTPVGMNGRQNSGNMNGNSRNNNKNNNNINFANDDFDDFNGWSNNKSMNGPGPIKGNQNKFNGRNAPYNGRNNNNRRR